MRVDTRIEGRGTPVRHPWTLAFVALAGATCGGSTDVVAPPPAPPNRPPVAIGTLAASTLAIGDSATVDVSQLFRDPDGDRLAYTVASTDPSRASARLAETDLLIVGVGAGAATVTVTAVDPGGLVAAVSGGVTVRAENRAPVLVAAIPRQRLQASKSRAVDVAAYFADPDGDALFFDAASSDTGVATAEVSGSTLTIRAVADGTTTVTVSATDPDGRSASQDVAVVVGAGAGSFRDDFDSGALAGWDLTRASAEVADGILRLANAEEALPGQLDRSLDANLSDWRIRARLGRAHDDVATRVVAYTAFAQLPAFAVEIGAGVDFQGQDTNFRVLIQGSGGGQVLWQIIGGDYLEAIADGVGTFVEIDFSVVGTSLRAMVDGQTAYEDSLVGAPASLRRMTRLGVWSQPLGEGVEKIALVDWIELSGDAGSASRQAGPVGPGGGVEAPSGRPR